MDTAGNVQQPRTDRIKRLHFNNSKTQHMTYSSLPVGSTPFINVRTSCAPGSITYIEKMSGPCPLRTWGQRHVKRLIGKALLQWIVLLGSGEEGHEAKLEYVYKKNLHLTLLTTLQHRYQNIVTFTARRTAKQISTSQYGSP